MISSKLKQMLLGVIAVLLMTACGAKYGLKQAGERLNATTLLEPLPPQPDNRTLKFVSDLKSPLWKDHGWGKQALLQGHASLANGVSIQRNFPDPEGVLETAYEDIELFFQVGKIAVGHGNFIIETSVNDTLTGEDFVLEINTDFCRISAGSTEGIRRGIFDIEDTMLKLEGGYLPLGTKLKRAVVKRRISRCAFGPIKRPPLMRDELLDTVNYYPDNYLNRLAHENVNGIWLTVDFRGLSESRYYKTQDSDAKQRLAKLQQIVQACKRYGIAVYIFCIEPKLAHLDTEQYPELIGAKGRFFCPSSLTASTYLYETVRNIFHNVPGLGGMINISHGERGTTCLSTIDPTDTFHKDKISCQHCKGKESWEILNASLSAMEKGMHDAAPEAELISWLYVPHAEDLAEWVYDLAEHTPEHVILQFNFESGVSKTVFGKEMVGGDYWISEPNASERFVRINSLARSKNVPVSAKIQTGNSHELATVPYISVPTLLYEKFKDIKYLGVEHVMLSWYFGSYPGLMTKGAGMLSFDSHGETLDEFIEELAETQWNKDDVPQIIASWKLFGEAFSHYPLDNVFQYYGPIHDGVVWPLYLKPADTYLTPTWTLGSSYQAQPKEWPIAGDRIGECISANLTLDEVTELCRLMKTQWSEGLSILETVANNYEDNNERWGDIVVARATGIQLRSGYNILKFYSLREEMFRSTGRLRLKMLNEMERIVIEEIESSKAMIALCHQDSRLGYHSEAEGYKYWPAKLEWRIRQLETMRKIDFPDVKLAILNDKPLFPAYTGSAPEGLVMHSVSKQKQSCEEMLVADNWLDFTSSPTEGKTQWASAHDDQNLYIAISNAKQPENRRIEVMIEPRRLWPIKNFSFNNEADKDEVQTKECSGRFVSVVTIPLETIGEEAVNMQPIRVNIKYGDRFWKSVNPWPIRLGFNDANPADLVWVVFQ